MQHDDLDREQAICASPISAYCQHHCEFSRAARTAWPARIEECRRLRAEIERLKAAGELLAEQVSIDLSQPAIVVALDADVVAELERACEAFGKGN